MAHGFQIEAFQNVQGFDHDWTLGPEAGLIDLVAAIGPHFRLVDFGVIVGEIAIGNESVVLFGERRDAARDIAFIEKIANGAQLGLAIPVRFFFSGGELAEGSSQHWLPKNFAARRRLAVRIEEFDRIGPQSDDALVAAEHAAELFGHGEALLGVLDGGLGHLGERLRSVGFERQNESVEDTGRDGGEDALHRHGRHVTGLFPQLGRTMHVEIDCGFGGRHSHAADGDGGLAGHLDQQRHLAPESETAEFGNARCQNAGYARIHGIAALGQDAVSGFDFEIVGRGDHIVR